MIAKLGDFKRLPAWVQKQVSTMVAMQPNDLVAIQG